MIKSNILALDASTEALSIVLHFKGQTFHHFEECPQQHSQKILPLIEQSIIDQHHLINNKPIQVEVNDNCNRFGLNIYSSIK